MSDEATKEASASRPDGEASSPKTPQGGAIERPNVSLADHKKMARLGISYRPSDGKWGFKRKCARSGCDKTIQHACYCSDTLEEAFIDVEIRSAYTCSTRCSLMCGNDALLDSFREWKPGDVAAFARGKKFTDRDYEAVEAALRRGKPDSVRGVRRLVLLEWAEEEMSNWEGDGDDGECSCEL